MTARNSCSLSATDGLFPADNLTSNLAEWKNFTQFPHIVSAFHPINLNAPQEKIVLSFFSIVL